MRTLVVLSPIALAASAFIDSARASAAWLTVADDVSGVAAGVGLAAATYLSLALLLRRHMVAERLVWLAALILPMIVGGGGLVYDLAVAVHLRQSYALIAHSAGTCALLGILLTARNPARHVATMAVAAWILFGLQSAEWVAAGIANRKLERRMELLSSWSEPRTSAALPTEPKRDIYVVVLDEYGSPAMLRKYFDLDIRPFEDTLRGLGFQVLDDAQANYPHTIHALAGILNYDYLDPVAVVLGTRERSILPIRMLVHRNRLFTLAKRRGYTVYFVPSERDHDTQSFADASEIPLQAQRPIVNRLWDRIGWAWLVTLPGYATEALGYDPEGPEPTLRTERLLERAPGMPGPKLVFAHLMLTHPPFRRGPLGRSTRCKPANIRSYPYARYRRAYSQQVVCTNAIMLRFVRAALARSRPAPVVLIMADHGFRPNGDSRTFVEQRYGAFAAYLLPGALTGSVRSQAGSSPISVMRYVASRYLGAAAPPLPDHSVAVSFAWPLRFVPIDSNRASVLPF